MFKKIILSLIIVAVGISVSACDSSEPVTQINNLEENALDNESQEELKDEAEADQLVQDLETTVEDLEKTLPDTDYEDFNE